MMQIGPVVVAVDARRVGVEVRVRCGLAAGVRVIGVRVIVGVKVLVGVPVSVRVGVGVSVTIDGGVGVASP